MLGEVEMICDRVAILRKGLMIREGDVATLTRQKGRFLVGLAPEQKLPVSELQSLGYTVQELGQRWEVFLEESQNIDAIVDLIRTRGLNLRHLVEKRQTLEDLFLETHSAERPERKKRAEAEPSELKTAIEEHRP
jgi:ABC-2 type transport system ATP-binding protein